MGQKTHPKGFRLIVDSEWESMWYVERPSAYIVEDFAIRDKITKMLHKTGLRGVKIVIRRRSGKIEIVIKTSRPGIVIGKAGNGIKELKKKISQLVNGEVWVDVEEIKKPNLDATVVANSVAYQLERRMSARNVLLRTVRAVMDSGAKGVKVLLAGRIGGAEMARRQGHKEGRIPLHTMSSKIDYCSTVAETPCGSVGVKVWINLGGRL